MILRHITLLLVVLGLFGCSDNAIVKVDKKALNQKSIPCMQLMIFPPNEQMQYDFEHLYPFTQTCEYVLHVSYKSHIVCNATTNVDKKALGMQNAYLRLELKKGQRVMMSYYKDLSNVVDTDAIEDAFVHLEPYLKR